MARPQQIFQEAHKAARVEFDAYARRQGFTYQQTFCSVLRGFYAARAGYDGSFVR